MSLTPDPTLRDLNDCGCCEGLTAQTPVKVENRPGLSAIAYRVGVHAQFKQAMLALLSDARLPALRDLRTRDDDDFSIALLDAWATVADVLTFYQERIANESYLRTATERLSLLHLARLIGYELRPGLAAHTYLAFTMDQVPSMAISDLSTSAQPAIPVQVTASVPTRTTIGVGTKVQSIPGPDERPQTFETVEEIEARVEWNAMRPRLTQRHPTRSDADQILLDGATVLLHPGDGLVLFPDGGGDPVFRLVAEVTPQPEHQRTEVKLQPPIWPLTYVHAAAPVLQAYASTEPSAVVAALIHGSRKRSTDLAAIAEMTDISVDDVFANLQATRPPPPHVLAFRTRAAIFGHNAPIKYYYDGSWQATSVDSAKLDGEIHLDRVYPGIVKDSWVVLKEQGFARLYQVSEVTELGRSAYSLSARVSRLTLGKTDDLGQFSIRATEVFAQSQELDLARWSIEKPVSGIEIELEGWVAGLSAGQSIIVCGELDKDRGNRACERATIEEVEHDISHEGGTKITLCERLVNDYVRDTVTINANVALATHGETVQEVLGSGDAAQLYQRFTLRQPPLTYVSADTPSGAESTLQVRVNDVLWHEVQSLYGREPEERVYVTRRGDDGKTTLQFGDGKTGARLPTGQENVRATYRKGSGLEGLVKANQLTLLMTRPLGVRDVTNPLPARGADDPESRDDARRNAPLTVLTLDRIVSLQDYEDFARAYAGIAKALATWTWDGEKRGVFVTVAGPKGEPIAEDGKTYENLLAAMKKAGDPWVPLRVKSYRRALFTLSARVRIDADHQPERVLAAVEQALCSHFSFEARQFGQAVTFGEVIAVIQGVPGVVGANVEKLRRIAPAALLPLGLYAALPGAMGMTVERLHRIDPATPLPPGLYAAVPQAGSDGEVSAAELLTLDPGSLDLGTM